MIIITIVICCTLLYIFNNLYLFTFSFLKYCKIIDKNKSITYTLTKASLYYRIVIYYPLYYKINKRLTISATLQKSLFSFITSVLSWVVFQVNLSLILYMLQSSPTLQMKQKVMYCFLTSFIKIGTYLPLSWL